MFFFGFFFSEDLASYVLEPVFYTKLLFLCW